MRSFLAIWFSFLFLLQGFTPNLDLSCELERIPNLINHYSEHNAFDGDSFYQFLLEDFFDKGHDLAGKHDTEEHENMPFHGSHSCSHASIFIPEVPAIEIAFVQSNWIQTFLVFNETSDSDFTYQPFQPPRA